MDLSTLVVLIQISNCSVGNFIDRCTVFNNLISPNCITNLMIHFRNINDHLVAYRTDTILPSSVLYSSTVFLI